MKPGAADIGQKVPEIRLQEDDKMNEAAPEDPDKLAQKDKRAISPLSFLREDFTQFKEGVLKVLKDKDTKTEFVDLLGTSESRRTNSTLGLLKEDFNQLKEDVTKVFSISSSKEKETKQEDGPTSQSGKKLSIMKEDFTEFKGGVLKLFRDKNTKTELEDRPMSQAENSGTSIALGLLKEDFNQFREDVSRVFSTSASKDQERKTKHEDNLLSRTENRLGPLEDDEVSWRFKEDETGFIIISSSKDKEMKGRLDDHPLSQKEMGLLSEDCVQVREDATGIREINLHEDLPSKLPGNRPTSDKHPSKDDLSLLTEDEALGITSSKDKVMFNRLTLLKDDLTNVFKTGRVPAKDDSSNTLEVKAEKTQPFKNLFKRDQRTSQTVENGNRVKKSFLRRGDDQMDNGRGGHLSTFTSEGIRVQRNEPEEMELELSSCAEKSGTSVSEIRPSEEKIPSTEEEDDTFVMSEEERRRNKEEDETSGTHCRDSLSPRIRLFSPRDPTKDKMRNRPGDELWSVKNFACYLTLDPNTANSELRLTECNRKVTRLWLDLPSTDHPASDHPDQFKHCPQVLCREGLLDSVYWEVVWSGGADIGVTYNGISRDGDMANCLLGHNKQSWSLECSEGSYIPSHDNKRFKSSSPEPFTHRVGVYLDWSAGSLSFYCVSQDIMVHLHTFTASFTEPLYPAFWVWAYNSSVSLSHVELSWKRLMQ